MRYVGSRDSIEPSLLPLELALSNLQVLRLLPLERAVVKFDIRYLLGDAGKIVDAKIELLAAKFREMLLDPSGPEKVKKLEVPMKGSRLHSQLPSNIFCSQDMYLRKGLDIGF